jgi:hypothetical protein
MKHTDLIERAKTDNGAALELAAKLRLDMCWNQNEDPWEFNAWPQGGGMGSNAAPADHGDDNAAAMRSAIVEAAERAGAAA